MRAAISPRLLGCSQSLRKFTELPDAIDADDTISADDKLRKDLKSKLALGLYAEAKALLTFADDEQWEPYRKFIAADGKPSAT